MRVRQFGLFGAMALMLLLLYSSLVSNPSFNGSDPGCGGSGCHTLEEGLVTVVHLNNLDVEVTVHGVSSGKKVAGELIDLNGNVVSFNDETSNNPFILTAPQAGEYQVNAGFKNPSRKWDSVMVALSLAPIAVPDPARPVSRFELFPNHPNPFNSETVVRFSLAAAADLKLTIYNLNGQVVKHLAGERFSAGSHTLHWDGRDDRGSLNPTGVYFLEISDGVQRTVQKMILAK